MNDATEKSLTNNSGFEVGDFEETLRVIAHLPAPEGIADRIQAGLRARQLSPPRSGRILDWPAALRPGSEWMRSAAAAAIVFVVLGGGWGVYTRVHQNQPARVIMMPRVVAPGGFSGAGAMRTPNTLNGPVLSHPVAVKPGQDKATAPTTQKPVKRAHLSAAGKAGDQPASGAAAAAAK